MHFVHRSRFWCRQIGQNKNNLKDLTEKKQGNISPVQSLPVWECTKHQEENNRWGIEINARPHTCVQQVGYATLKYSINICTHGICLEILVPSSSWLQGYGWSDPCQLLCVSFPADLDWCTRSRSALNLLSKILTRKIYHSTSSYCLKRVLIWRKREGKNQRKQNITKKSQFLV